MNDAPRMPDPTRANDLRASDDAVTVSIANPKTTFTLVDNAALAPVVTQADERPRSVMHAVPNSEEAL